MYRRHPIPLPWGKWNVIPGLQQVVVGMRAGGKRRAMLPPVTAYGEDVSLQPQPPTFPTKRQLLNHAKEPLLFEVKLLKFR
eukprot:jgi/Botrbrau1/2976/Bobra.0026s0040.1